MSGTDIVTYAGVLRALMRYLAPILSFILLLRCGKSLLTFRKQPELWGYLRIAGEKHPIYHWENVIGRSKRCDICVDIPTVSRNHAVLTRYDDGSWTISDAHSKDGVFVNGKKTQIQALQSTDEITIGGVPIQLEPASPEQEKRMEKARKKASSGADSIANLLLLTLLQAMTCLCFLFGCDDENRLNIVLSFGSIMILQWLLLVFYFVIFRPAFEVETIAFFLCTIGMAIICSVSPQEGMKQVLAIVLGMLAFLIVGWSLRDLERAKQFRILAALGGVGLLVITLLFGKEYYGAKNWLKIGSFSLQPSELAKICFVYVGASSLDRLMNRRNLILFIAYTVVLCGCLALMNDFGTALIFFCAFLMIAFLRSGSVGTIALACTALGFAGVIGLRMAPHAMRRFTVWRHIWEEPLGAGYQQTRALMCIASGGLFGIGIGDGKMKQIFAADSDVVFATLSEEWGLVMALLTVTAILILALFAIRCAGVSRSSFYTIGSCTAAAILLIQTAFNVLGTVDVLPLTGVTFPFVSNGGSSMICVWGLLAFVKAADTRKNASFAVRLIKGRRFHA